MSREFDEVAYRNKIPLGNLFRGIFARIFALYGLIIFFLSLLVTVVVIWIKRAKYKDPELSISLHSYFRKWMRFFTTMILSPVRTIGEENFQPGENYIVVCNHKSLMDVPLSTPFIPGPNKTIAKKSMARIPLFGIVYRSGSILVDRRSERSRRKSYEEMKKVLGMGLHMCIYPEGTRNRTGLPLKHFRDGAFRLSTETGKKIIPAVITNTSKVLPANQIFYLWPSPLYIKFLEPIDPTGIDPRDLNQKVFRVMWEEIEKGKTKGRAKRKKRSE